MNIENKNQISYCCFCAYSICTEISLSKLLHRLRVSAAEKHENIFVYNNTSNAENAFYILENILDPDQLASCESILSGSTPFSNLIQNTNIDIVMIFFSYSGSSGILGCDGKQNAPLKLAIEGVRIGVLSIRSHEQTK